MFNENSVKNFQKLATIPEFKDIISRLLKQDHESLKCGVSLCIEPDTSTSIKDFLYSCTSFNRIVSELDAYIRENGLHLDVSYDEEKCEDIAKNLFLLAIHVYHPYTPLQNMNDFLNQNKV